jgi:predicted flavoprotein YhiN
MGASDFGYRLARQFGLNVRETRAGLVPFVFSGTARELMERLSGISLYAALSTSHVTFADGVLFTHRGLSGPAALQLSSYWEPGSDIRLNLLPEHDAVSLLLEAKVAQPKALMRTVLSAILPRALVLALEPLWWQDSAEVPLAEISGDILRQVADHLHEWTLRPAATEGWVVSIPMNCPRKPWSANGNPVFTASVKSWM